MIVEVALAIIQSEQGVLLGRKHEGKHPSGLGGMWVLPGGRIKVGKGLSEAVCREVLEETGLSVVVEQSLGKCPDAHSNEEVILNYLLCAKASGQLYAGDDLKEVKWVALTEVQGYLAPRMWSMLSVEVFAWLDNR